MTQPISIQKQVSHPSLAEAVGFWLKLGFVSFGGPAAILSMLHTELVERKRWIGEKRFLHALNFCMTLPGPTAHQLAIYVGWLLHGTFGGVIAGVFFVLPATIIMIGLSWSYMVFGEMPILAGLLHGFKPAVLAIVAFAVVRLGRHTLTTPPMIALAATAFVAIAFFNVPFPFIVLGAALAGLIIARTIQAPSDVQTADKTEAVLGDTEVSPAHTRPSWLRTAVVLAVGLAFWWGPIYWSIAMLGRFCIWTQMAYFSTKAALVSFGGGYAVLAYVAQVAVEHYQWVTAHQMADGLALGETTPGPLIMVLTFVGFAGGWQLGNFSWPGAVMAALYMTYYTFLPSFIFVLVGGPWIESMRGNLRLTAPLSGISAATIGVIGSLGVFLARRVALLPGGGIDWFVVGLAIVVLVGLWRFKLGMATVVAASGLVGLAWQMAFRH